MYVCMYVCLTLDLGIENMGQNKENKCTTGMKIYILRKGKVKSKKGVCRSLYHLADNSCGEAMLS